MGRLGSSQIVADEEISEDLHVPLPFFVMGRVT